MAIRNIRELGDDVLRKKSREITEITPKINDLIDDMFETMYEADGVGLAAPQVGILKKLVVIDVGDGEPLVMINPEILETSGNQTGYEGCLSVPGKTGIVSRPDHVKARALDRNLKTFVVEGDGLLARAICHEIDHLEGKMYVDLVEGELFDAGTDEDDE